MIVLTNHFSMLMVIISIKIKMKITPRTPYLVSRTPYHHLSLISPYLVPISIFAPMPFTHQSINGKILPKAEALIPLTDLGLLRAYAIFDFFRVLNGVPVFLEDHLDRMMGSASKMDLELRWSRDEIRKMIHDVIIANDAHDAGFRVVVTGGFSEDGFSPGTPNIYMMLHDLPVYDPMDVVKGCKLITSEYLRDVPSVKTCNYVQSLMLNKRRKEEGAVEVLYHWKGSISECSRSNLFYVTPQGTLVTTRDGLLNGITRKHVLQIAEDSGILVELRDVHLEELPWFKEVLLTSSTRGVLPIVQIDKQVIGDGKPGEMTKMLHDVFAERVKKVIGKLVMQ